MPPEQAMKRIKKLEAEMYKHARNLEFEQAAQLRDQIEKLRQQAFGVAGRGGGLTRPAMAASEALEPLAIPSGLPVSFAAL